LFIYSRLLLNYTSMATGCSTESVRVLAFMLATMWLMVFHLMGCDNDCSSDIGTYEPSRDGITYRVMIDYAGDEFFNADLTFSQFELARSARCMELLHPAARVKQRFVRIGRPTVISSWKLVDIEHGPRGA
ncbi:hypothetical protein FOL47_006365, partial [Perkinsus chesapeaki]